jgi:hypothetical protein
VGRGWQHPAVLAALARLAQMGLGKQQLKAFYFSYFTEL